MDHHRLMLGLLVALMSLAVLSRVAHPTAALSLTAQVIWNGFLFGVPIVLGGFLLAKARWALMVGVMYGTVGLALDISTLVQEATRPETRASVLALSGLTGLLNFLLIALGGRGFLDVRPDGRPPAGRPPNLRPPSSSSHA